MKKNYMPPQTAVFKLEPSKLIAESLGLDGTKTLDSSGDILTKEYNDWDIWGNNDDTDYDE